MINGFPPKLGARGAGRGGVNSRRHLRMKFSLTPVAQHAPPWLGIGLILLLAYGFSLLTTILPAVQAARIYLTEALRYE